MSKKSNKYRLQQPKPTVQAPQQRTQNSKAKDAVPVLNDISKPDDSILKWALLLIVIVTTFICYSYTLKNQFTNWDDGLYVETNPYIKNLTNENLKMILFHNITNNYYHPITMLTIAWNYYTSKMDPHAYYLTNVSIHVMGTCTVFFLVLLLLEAMEEKGYGEIKGKLWLAALGALFFGVHPMHVESVSWLAERKDVLYAMFYFLGMIAYIKLQKNNLRLFLVFIFYLCSLASKPLAVVFPFSLYAIDVLLKRDIEKKGLIKDMIAFGSIVIISVLIIWVVIKANLLVNISIDAILVHLKISHITPILLLVVIFGGLFVLWKYVMNWLKEQELSNMILEKFPFFFISLTSGIWAWHAQKASGAVASFGAFTILQRLMFAAYGFCMYVAKAFVPLHLCSYYPYPNTDTDGFMPFYFYIGPVVALAILAVPIYIAYRAGEKYLRIVIFGLGFFLFNVLFVLQFVSSGPAIMADRYSYVAYFGIFFLVVYFAGLFIEKLPVYKIPMQGLMLGFTIMLAYICYDRTRVWHNTKTLWEDVIKKYPFRVQTAYKNLGNYYADLGPTNFAYYDSAYTNYVTLVKIHLADAGTYSNIANIYGLRKQFDSSLISYNMALKMDSTNFDAHLDRAITYSMMKRYDKALIDYDYAGSLQPLSEKLLENRASTYLYAGMYAKAVADFSSLIKINPDRQVTYLDRGAAEWDMGDYKNALADLNYYHKLDPTNGQCLFDLAVTYEKLKDYKNALDNALQARNAKFDVKDQYINYLKQQIDHPTATK